MARTLVRNGSTPNIWFLPPAYLYDMPIKAATDRDRGLSRAAAARAIVDRFASRRDLFRDYYSFDLLASRDASARWIPPDRAPK